MIGFLYTTFLIIRQKEMAVMKKTNGDYQNYSNPKDFYEVEIP